MRKVIIICGLVLLVVGGVLTWRATHPPLSDTEQIAANLEGAAEAIEDQAPRSLTGYFAPEFTWRGFDREYINNNLSGLSLQWRDVELRLASVNIELGNNTATAGGNFTLRYRSRGSRHIETRIGRFKTFWEKRDGQWLITKAEGGENIEP